MFSVCQVVIVVQDWLTDIDLWKFVRTVEMLKYRIPDIASHMSTLPDDHTEQNEYYPDTVFVFNKQPDEVFAERAQASLRHSLNRFFADSKCNQKSTTPHDSTAFFLLPVDDGRTTSLVQHIYSDPYDVSIQRFRYHVLGMPKRSFSRPLTERDWLKNAGRIWELIKKSPFISDYSRTLNKMCLYQKS